MIARFFRWWFGELSALVPGWLRGSRERGVGLLRFRFEATENGNAGTHDVHRMRRWWQRLKRRLADLLGDDESVDLAILLQRMLALARIALARQRLRKAGLEQRSV